MCILIWNLINVLNDMESEFFTSDVNWLTAQYNDGDTVQSLRVVNISLVTWKVFHWQSAVNLFLILRSEEEKARKQVVIDTSLSHKPAEMCRS